MILYGKVIKETRGLSDMQLHELYMAKGQKEELTREAEESLREKSQQVPSPDSI
ncbi:MAG: hypothetical protein P4M11_10255 [Candidatus Pacebacteria bacterium]|nr:hypothetical protein [Candidatus Paceibacterota bacterium]